LVLVLKIIPKYRLDWDEIARDSLVHVASHEAATPQTPFRQRLKASETTERGLTSLANGD
jgi:hypothetical protein